MQSLAFDVEVVLPGWTLLWADLACREGARPELAELRETVAEAARMRHQRQPLAQHPPLAAMRKLFRATGCDPTRYRPSSEALLRRLTKGDPLPGIHPLVDLANCLSADVAVPCCVMAEGTFAPPFLFRIGAPLESYDSLRGPFNAKDKPLLLDALGPCDTPITGSQRVKVTENTRRVWLVAYLPGDVVKDEKVELALRQLLAAAPIADLLRVGSVSGPPRRVAGS